MIISTSIRASMYLTIIQATIDSFLFLTIIFTLPIGSLSHLRFIWLFFEVLLFFHSNLMKDFSRIYHRFQSFYCFGLFKQVI